MTIYALSSGPGLSGVAVIRISGPDTKKIISNITKGSFPSPRVASLRKILDERTKELIDEGIVIWFPGPNSYTGEDMAELHVHGSRAVIQSILENISKIEGSRIAEPGEFTKRAFQNEKINLLKAESIGDLIASETEIQRKQALKIMSGKSSEKFDSWRKILLKILSNLEAKIDFPDEDLPSNILNNIKKDSQKIKLEIKKVLNDSKVGERVREGFKIAIIGPTNAGKSSLLNYFSKREVAIVSEIAGTTRDIIEVHLNIDGFPVIMSDTAGIRNSKDEIEKKGIKLALKRAEDADLNILVFEPKSVDFTGFLSELNIEKSIFVINKSDLGKIRGNHLDKYKPISISIKDETNIEKLIDKIKQNLINKFVSAEDTLITRERHRQHLEQCIFHLDEFSKKEKDSDFDKATEDIRLATRHLGMLVGKVDVEEILGSIFNDFCIGK
ncbi:tRNA uridine-5-carboxymethylaminomethyl(34) synthesis GTPase MnmE [Candidatus Pelagibacter sp.]|nr:tRNA uridine-5-carboxymethylaminomethyl(34) synthesis GTPase MnmE [Candidatus Pelagibacter sp.]